MVLSQSLLIFIKSLVLSSVLFVWVVRYQNIVEEFKHFSYPNWLRDIVGILKITFAVLLLNDYSDLVKVGSLGISLLMVAAFVTHLKVKNPFHKMMPSLSLLLLNLLIFTQT